jgi:hypothetical protein
MSGILKWTHASSSDDLVPFKVNCWPEEESRGLMNVSIEYTMDQPRLGEFFTALMFAADIEMTKYTLLRSSGGCEYQDSSWYSRRVQYYQLRWRLQAQPATRRAQLEYCID